MIRGSLLSQYEFHYALVPETVCSLTWPREKGPSLLSLAVADIEPAGAIALAASFLIFGPRGQAGGAGLPIDCVEGASIHSGAPLPRHNLCALPVDLVRGVGDGAAAGADGHGLCFLARHGRRVQCRTKLGNNAGCVCLPRYGGAKAQLSFANAQDNAAPLQEKKVRPQKHSHGFRKMRSGS